MTIKLTDRFLTSRKAPLTGRAVYTDATVPGLAFRVSASTPSNPVGRRDWLLRYRPRGQQQKAVALGAYPAVSLSMARQRAGEVVAAAKRGVNLIEVEEREPPPSAPRKPRRGHCQRSPIRISIPSSTCGHGVTSKAASAATSSRNSATRPWAKLQERIWSIFLTGWNARKVCDTK